ncbi:zinc finger BED domain-containing protein RICESLEEPER 1-like [Canna indica]|uniref:Zinc finger BED domain-containing protein RICESLEEPER 1-like n=1 Tax=Canna indica TaxID=4628 RepID=A0AAQ3KKC1_9LILI|nr:zinc finger BED domain-containing protein RICESLEEPER 1-like [Canna indica]
MASISNPHKKEKYKKKKKKKKKAMMASWDESDASSSEEDTKSEKANLCLMANDDEVRFTFGEVSFTQEELENEFEQMHDEFNAIRRKFKDLKNDNKSLELENDSLLLSCNALRKEVDTLKEETHTLEKAKKDLKNDKKKLEDENKYLSDQVEHLNNSMLTLKKKLCMLNEKMTIIQNVMPKMAEEISPNVDIGVEVLDNSNNLIESSGSGLGPALKKRKIMKPRGDVWNHYTKFTNKEGKLKGKCNYCGQEYAYDTKQCGTSTLKAHLEKCFEYPPNKEKQQKKQTKIGYTPNLTESGPGSNTMSTWRFDQAATRKSLARMIIKDEYPFSCVDGEGFRDFCATGMPRFQIPSRQTVSRDCYELHRGENIGKAIEKCLNDWVIDKVMTIIVDNASSNDTVIAFLKKKMKNWPDGCVMNGEFLHMRCFAHCMNLVVQDGLKLSNMSLTRVREAIR